jgi:hypothetical protein
MADKNVVIKLGVDMVKGKVNTEFASGSYDEQMAVLRDALIEANGGSDKLNYKTMRGNRELFAIIEQILELTDVQGFENNPFFEQFVDFRNVALGDENKFYIEDNSLFTVNTMAEGIGMGLRQRINKGSTQTVTPVLHTVSAYEDVNRLLSGRIDIVQFVEKIRKSFENKRMTAIYNAMATGLSGLPAVFKASGSYAEATLQDLIAHVEASTGQRAMIVGTKKALGKVTTAVVSESAKERYNQAGFYGVFNGTPMMSIMQSHVAGGFTFAIDDTMLWVVTADSKPLKFVTEGESLFEQGDVMKNADRTIDMFAGERWGVAAVFNSYIAQYDMA